jgi:hypothetical protein
LSAAVFGATLCARSVVAKRIRSGICHINAPTVHDEGQMPFGGTKASGYGRFGGKAAIERIHRAALGDHPDGAAPLPVLTFHERQQVGIDHVGVRGVAMPCGKPS